MFALHIEPVCVTLSLETGASTEQIATDTPVAGNQKSRCDSDT
jgi:hypothetical protein